MLTPLSPLDCGETVLQPGEAVPLTLAGWRGLIRLGRIGWQEPTGEIRRIRGMEGIASDGSLHPSRIAADRHDQRIQRPAPPSRKSRSQVSKTGGP